MCVPMNPVRRNLLKFGAGAAAGLAGVAAFGALAVAESDPERIILTSAPKPAPAASSVAPAAPAIVRATPAGDVRRAFLHNLHTGEQLDAVYWEDGRYVPDALAEAMRVMRDWRNGQEHVMDPRLFDVLHGIQGRIEVNQPFQLISGYRSPATNAMLHAESGQVASHSQHMLGKASDIRVEGVELADLHKAALSLGAGGVGYYPVSNFVHVDVGRVRTWNGT
jgi:uncharacterized protein YcbK (DUF882 family)